MTSNGATVTPPLIGSSWAALLAGANFFFFEHQSYFQSAVESPLLHCWSLAVEEQFYAVYPLMLYALWVTDKCLVFPVLIFVFLGSLGLSVFLTPGHVSFAFYLLPARAWQMALGCLVAFDRGRAFHVSAIAELAAWT